MSAKETLELLAVGVTNSAWVFYRTTCELCRFSVASWWWRLRLALLSVWFFTSPLAVIVRADSKRNSDYSIPDFDDLTYGETIPGTAYDLLKKINFTSGDTLVDLGCGRAVPVFTASLAFKAKAIGVDVLEEYVKKGSSVALLLKISHLASFKNSDFRKEPIPKGTVYFLSGTCLQDSSWEDLVKNLVNTAPKDCRIISISQKLPKDKFEELFSDMAPFSWGKATVYAYRFKGNK